MLRLSRPEEPRPHPSADPQQDHPRQQGRQRERTDRQLQRLWDSGQEQLQQRDQPEQDRIDGDPRRTRWFNPWSSCNRTDARCPSERLTAESISAAHRSNSASLPGRATRVTTTVTPSIRARCPHPRPRNSPAYSPSTWVPPPDARSHRHRADQKGCLRQTPRAT